MPLEILYGDYMMRFQKIDSKNEMKEALTRCSNGFLELIEPEYHCAYGILRYRLFGEKGWFGVGIYSTSQSFPPQVVASCNDNGLLILYDKYVSLFDMYKGEVSFNHESESIVYFAKYHKNTIVVIAELSATQLNMNGDVLTTCIFDDILESFSFENDKLVCRTMSGSTQYNLICPSTIKW